jgi:iron(III) transport system ATP-binding protein
VTALRATGIHKAFGSERVLRGVELDVADGTLAAVLGPSGCGKTTLLRLIAGFDRPDAGTIAFGEQVVCGDGAWVAPQRRRVGYVAQEGALFPHLDVAANVGFGLPRARRRRAGAKALLALVDLDPALADRYPHELSGGQQQRVALARALAPEPSLVLLDEPFAALDASLRLQTGEAVAAALRARGSSAVLVTHDQAEALSLADQVAVMDQGRIVQAGTPAEVYAEPVDARTAAFVGEALLLDATFHDGRARCALGTLDVVAADGVPASGRGTVLVRPEQLRLDTGTDGVRAEVCDVRFFGHDSTVGLRLLDGALRVQARLVGGTPPAPGTAVRVSVAGAARSIDPGRP